MVPGQLGFLNVGVLLLCLFSLNAFSYEAVPGEYVLLLKANAKESLFLKTHRVHAYDAVGMPIRLIRVPESLGFSAQEALSFLNRLPEVELVEPNYIYQLETMEVPGAKNQAGKDQVATPNDPEFAKQWALANTGQADGWGRAGRLGVDAGIVKGWALQTGRKEIVIAEIDSGVNYKHQELADNIWVNTLELNGQAGVDDDKNGFIDDVHGYDFVNNDGDPLDDHGHGTHVASVMAAKANNAYGTAGVAWNVSVMPIKFASKEGKGTHELGIRAIQYATQMGAHIINNSWGGRNHSEIMERVVEEANKKNILFVAAAGNSGWDNAEIPIYPASLKNENVVSVASYDQHGQMWSGSCFGATTVHLGAPGVDVAGLWGDSLRRMIGTSMAAPHVSGVAALVLSQEPHLTVRELKDRLLKSARPMAGLRDKTITGGTVDAYYALTNQLPPMDQDDPVHWKNKKTLNTSTSHPYPDKAKLVWEFSFPGAKEVSLFFQKFELEFKQDRVDLFDRQGNRLFVLHGKSGHGWSPIIPGDYVKVMLVSDEVNGLYGFDITEAAYR